MLPLARDIAKVEAAMTSAKITAATGDHLLALSNSERLRRLGAKRCSCERPFASIDPDGDFFCVKCGRRLGRVAMSINGFDPTQHLMEANGAKGRVVA